MNTNHINLPTNQQWINHINSLIAAPLADIPFVGSCEDKTHYINTFADEYANRRATDRPFLAHLLCITLDQPKDLDSLDQQLWWMVQSANFDANSALSLIEPTDALVNDSEHLAIEYRTMVELCALHALWIIANRSNSAQLIARCLNAAAWHTRELQPDNAINRPWATPVFIALSQSDMDQETKHLAHLHAQTLIHNTSINLGVPDKLSALILKDTVSQLAKRSPTQLDD